MPVLHQRYRNTQPHLPVHQYSLPTNHNGMFNPNRTKSTSNGESLACSIANDNIKQQCSWAIDMCFYWVCNRVRQGQFNIHWKPGKVNLADYYTKLHSAAHHQQVCPLYLHMENTTASTVDPIAAALHVLQGCAKPRTMAQHTAKGSGHPEHLHQHARQATHHHASMPCSEVTTATRQGSTCKPVE
jgi:hypothetical protein